MADHGDAVGAPHRINGVGGREGAVRRLQHGQVVGVVADADEGMAPGEPLQLPGHSPLVGPLGGELHQVVAGKDHFVLLLPAVVRHEGPELLQRSHFRHEQHLGQRDGDGFPVQCADLQERHPGEQGVLDVPLGGVEGVDALIGEIQLHGRARKGSLQPHHVLQRTVRQELADQIALPGQIVDAAAVIHNDGRVDGDALRMLPEGPQGPPGGDGELPALGNPALRRRQVPRGGRRHRLRPAAGEGGFRVLKGIVVVADQQHSIKFSHKRLLRSVEIAERPGAIIAQRERGRKPPEPPLEAVFTGVEHRLDGPFAALPR